MEIEKEIQEIKSRNRKVEADKAWERSWSRRLFIVIATYIVAAFWLVVIKDTQPFLKALIPAVGYLLSTLSIPWVKRIWLKNHPR